MTTNERPASLTAPIPSLIGARTLRIACVLAASLLSSSCARFEGTFSFLREQPKMEKIPGVYALDPKVYSYGMLKDQGYSDMSGNLTLHVDGTFTVS